MPDIRRAISIPSMPSKMNRQTLMFSATFPSEIQRLAGEFLNNYLHLQVTFAEELVSLFNPHLLSGWTRWWRLRRRNADVLQSLQVREEGQVHQHPQRGWAQRQGEDSGVRGDQEAGRFPLPQFVRGGELAS